MDNQKHIDALKKMIEDQIATRRAAASRCDESGYSIEVIEEIVSCQKRIDALKDAIADEQAMANGEAIPRVRVL
jgi:hypothetical protein